MVLFRRSQTSDIDQAKVPESAENTGSGTSSVRVADDAKVDFREEVKPPIGEVPRQSSFHKKPLSVWGGH